jgi:magnesium-transporting ATPase (P-type)
MSESSTESRLNAYQFSLRQLFLWMHIVAVACSAFAGIGQILGGSHDFRVLFTAVTIALASVCALGCGAALESKRATIIPVAGLVLTLLGTLMLLCLIWARFSMEWHYFLMTAVCINAVAFSHISLLSIARLSQRFRWAIFLAVISILTVSSLLSGWCILPPHQRFSPEFWSGYSRIIAVAAIFDAAMSVLIPIFHLMSYREMKALDSGNEWRPEAIDAEIDQLEGRLAELRQLRMEKSADYRPLESGGSRKSMVESRT